MCLQWPALHPGTYQGGEGAGAGGGRVGERRWGGVRAWGKLPTWGEGCEGRHWEGGGGYVYSLVSEASNFFFNGPLMCYKILIRAVQ